MSKAEQWLSSIILQLLEQVLKQSGIDTTRESPNGPNVIGSIGDSLSTDCGSAIGIKRNDLDVSFAVLGKCLDNPDYSYVVSVYCPDTDREEVTRDTSIENLLKLADIVSRN